MKNTTLSLHSEYSREDVHDIFSPETHFTPQAGTWGLQGIVEIPDQPGSYIFYVTFGQSQSGHDFEEYVTKDGVLFWQSQPKQDLQERRITQFISHDETQRNIHLFLRTKRDSDYTYLGRLKYLEHDITRERPVYFQWQLLDWPMPEAVCKRIGLNLLEVVKGEEQAEGTSQPAEPPQKDNLTLTPPPQGKVRGTGKREFKRAKRPDYLGNQAANQELGALGELLVILYEQRKLKGAGRPDLAEKVRHVSVLEHDTAGYDVQSFDLNGNKRFIEVKTTRGTIDSDFFFSATELAFAEAQTEHYELHRLYDYDDGLNTAKFFILSGAPRQQSLLLLTPTEFKVSIVASPIES